MKCFFKRLTTFQDIRFRLEFQSNEIHYETVIEEFKRSVRNFDSRIFLSTGDGEKPLNDLIIGILRNKSSIVYQTWSVRDFVQTEIRMVNQECFDELDGDGKSQCRKDVEKNLEKIFQNGQSCLATHQNLNVKEKSHDELFCINDHSCAACRTVSENECHFDNRFQEYRAEYEIELTVRTRNENSEANRIISVLDEFYASCHLEGIPDWCADRLIISKDAWHLCKPDAQSLTRTDTNFPESDKCENQELGCKPVIV